MYSACRVIVSACLSHRSELSEGTSIRNRNSFIKELMNMFICQLGSSKVRK